MAHPDPDQVIGRLAGARLGRAPAQAGEVCPDAELLAAYADGGLAADEAARLDAHLARCAACRRLAAALVPEPAAGVVAEPVTSGAVILPFRQRRVVVWMSAAAALLLAVTVWSVSRLSEPNRATQMASAPAEREVGPPPMAAPRPPAADAPAVTLALPEAVPAAPPEAAAPSQPRADAATAGSALDASSTLRQTIEAQDKADRAKRDRDAVARVIGDNEAKKLADAAVAASLDERTAQVTNQRPITTQTNTVIAGVSRAHGPLSQQTANVTQNAQTVAQAPPLPAPPASPAPIVQPARPAAAERRAEGAAAVTGGDASGRVNAPADLRLAKEEPSDRIGRSREADGVAGARAAFSFARAPVAASFAEPDGRLQWRITNGSRLESSSDGGTTWTERHRARVRLHAGSAPSIDVAWAVGDGGLVLRRAVPGGWAAVKAPADVALTGVSAASADVARVTAADGRIFETTDGGQTWTTAPEAPR